MTHKQIKRTISWIIIFILGFIISATALVTYLLTPKEKIANNPTEYQFNVDQKGYDIYSDDRKVGRINYGDNPSLDSLIDKDNL